MFLRMCVDLIDIVACVFTHDDVDFISKAVIIANHMRIICMRGYTCYHALATNSYNCTLMPPQLQAHTFPRAIAVWRLRPS